tara:strand:+ start:257 stop:598 length:342 start_codon:yes stop_codon:yes gene_type:complete
MVDKEQTVKLNEQSGIQFSLSFLIQILSTVIIAVWGYSQLEGRISVSERIAVLHTEKINDIELGIKESQDRPIPSDYVQNTTLSSHAGDLLELRERLQILERRLYEYNRINNQ